MTLPVDEPYNIGRSLRGMPQPTRGRKNVRKLVGGLDREKDDFYPTPASLTRALVKLEQFDGPVWECACGDGAMSRILAEGNITFATDLVARGGYAGGVDFLLEQKLMAPNIVTNPPFKLWQQFANHALDLGAEKVVLLGRVLNLEGKAASALMQRRGLARVLVSAGRVDILPPGAKSTGKGGIIAYAWYVFERGFRGDPVIKWFTPEKG
ncbi:hypothetical protein [Reyranella sp.]|uniref:hypothetical protein n=1 Tax=Reyranella sp. TaxID=1929291 RepID=UPI003D120F6C